MKKFQQKRKLKKIMYSSGMLIILILVALFLFNSTWDVYQKAKETADNKEFVRIELERLKEQERYLLDQINRLSTERGIEEEVRNKFNVSKENENVIIIVEESAEEEGKEKNILNDYWWQFWK